MTTRHSLLEDLFQQYRSRIAILLVLCAVVYFMVAFGEQAWRARQLQGEVSELNAAITRINHENSDLQQQIDAYNAGGYDDYVQARARRDLNLANPGETVLLVHWDNPPASAAATSSTQEPHQRDPNWKRWLKIFSGD
jgi:cell division protein FtsB